MIDFEILLSQIEKKVDKLPVETDFTLKELFDEKEWNNMTSTQRRVLGRIYKSKWNKGQILNVEYIENNDTPSHTHIYIKK